MASHNPKGSSVNWRITLITFGVGVAVWVVHLIAALLLIAEASFFPGAVHVTGGEWDAWMGPGWMFERSWCFGTIEDCANTTSTFHFTTHPLALILVFALWFAVCLLIGHLIARKHRITPLR